MATKGHAASPRPDPGAASETEGLSAPGWWARMYLWLTERLYDELAWAYDAISWAVSLGHWGKWQRLVLPHVTGARVVELGFGTGVLLVAMAARGWQVVGVEPSAAMHRAASRRLAGQSTVIPRIRARAQQLPFRTASVDALVCTFAAGFILEQDTLREAWRVLTPQGRLVVAGLQLETDCTPLRWITGGWLYSRPDTEARAAIGRVFAAHGFHVEVIEDRGRVRAPVYILTKDAGPDDNAGSSAASHRR